MSPSRRLVLVVRADPVICGHAGEARNMAEAALDHGFDDVRIMSWPIDRLIESGLPLKPLDTIDPYRAGITVERPDPVGNYKVIDGRYPAINARDSPTSTRQPPMQPWSRVDDPAGIAEAIDHAVLTMTPDERRSLDARARAHARQFDRTAVFERLLAQLGE